MEYGEHYERFSREAPDLAAELGPVRGLGGILDWMSERNLPLADIEIVQQDEFSLDFLCGVGDGRWIVFGIT